MLFRSSIMSVSAKRPSLDFIEAYKERIDFFKSNGVRELEDYSRGHLCKAMLLTCNNPMLSSEQKNIVDATFLSNWQMIKYSENVALPLRILFFMFRFLPKTTLRLLNILR